MANHERGRSPSAGQANRLNTAASASPHPPLDAASFTGASLQYNGLGAQPHTGAFVDSSFNQTENYLLGQHAALGSQSGDIAGHTFLQSQGNTSGFNYIQGGQDHVWPSTISHSNSPAVTNPDSSAFPSFDFNNTDFQDNSLDPSLLADLDRKPHIAETGPSLDPMAASMQPQSPTPPHLLPDMARRQSNSPSPHASPIFQPQSFGSRPRNTSETLDPSSAMYRQGQDEWQNMGAYRTHRRAPSDQYSDYSSHSNQASPYMPTYDSFEAHSSPLLNAQQDPALNDGLGLGQFSLNESQLPPQHSYNSPGHSPRISPQLVPQQQALPQFTAENNYGLSNNQFAQQNNGLDMFPPLSKPQSPSDYGQADQLSPPEINVEFAPPAASLMQNVRPDNDGEALSPPARSKFGPSKRLRGCKADTNFDFTAQSGNRRRAVSDSYAGSRPTSPAIPARGRSPSLQPQMQGGDNTLSPFDHSSRSPSPARGRDKSASRLRSSSHTSDQRDYILNLAEPERTPSNGVKDNGRVQKHPATFQCNLCPKRFTRAYNLRSHLRTHTDERPFVCTVCGKAFARQHDRKRHEGLHSGEKKFVCKGTLQSGSQWGCGRRFARADALGRHFRSEAGRVCIKPLLNEEAAERQKAWMEEQQQAQVAAGLVAPQPIMGQPQMDMTGNFLPAVLLQQYPALAGIDWSTVPQGPPPDEDYSGRSSFDHSSGGEYYDDLSENEMGMDPDSQMSGMSHHMGMQQNMDPGMGMQAQAGAQGYYGQSTGDYLSDFEGR